MYKCPHCNQTNTGAYISEMIQRSDDGKMFFLDFHCKFCLHLIHLEWHLTVEEAIEDKEYEKAVQKDYEEADAEAMREFVETVELPPFSS